jgi:hypothetical protein
MASRPTAGPARRPRPRDRRTGNAGRTIEVVSSGARHDGDSGWLGHRSITSTAVYTLRSRPRQCIKLWRRASSRTSGAVGTVDPTFSPASGGAPFTTTGFVRGSPTTVSARTVARIGGRNKPRPLPQLVAAHVGSRGEVVSLLETQDVVVKPRRDALEVAKVAEGKKPGPSVAPEAA